ncbi:MAG TPA: rhodanese-like domain-containing protein [Candidatus Acidoferrales bacterium]|nr:rhodanese-like domain-containing protein [Candidatus Acidoferrales bacterium]
MPGTTRYAAPLGWFKIIVLLACIGLRPAGLEAAHDQEDVVDTVTPERVKYYLDNKEPLFIIDLRSPKEFKEKRLPGARSIPLKEIEKNLAQIPRAGRVILYCDCPQNVLIQDAYQVLKDDHGYRNIAIMPEGFKGWLKRNFPVESGAKSN